MRLICNRMIDTHPIPAVFNITQHQVVLGTVSEFLYTAAFDNIATILMATIEEDLECTE